MVFRRSRTPRLLPSQLVVTGERHHSANIQQVLTRAAGGRLQHQCLASIRRESNNASDPNAVAVTVDDLRVGYIARAHSEDVAKSLGDRSAELKCIINWNGESINGIYRVKLFPDF